MNDITIIEDSNGKGVSLDLPKIDDIGSLKFITLEVPRFFRPLELLVLGSFKLLELENRLLKPMLRPFEELIKPVDSLNLDEI